jgi:hypothetical protein
MSIEPQRGKKIKEKTMLKINKGEIDINGSGEEIVSDFIALAINVVRILSEQLKHDEEDILSKLYQTVSFALLEENKKNKGKTQ